ncbi:MAG: S41 family peptidase [Tissierellia bacterium]|nr:S41 family peptidase [Tissierellia bacterium]
MKKRAGIFTIFLLIVTNLFTFYFAKKSSYPAGLDMKKMIKLQLVEDYVKKNYLREVHEEDFYTGQLKGVVNSLEDPYSEYLTKEDMKKLTEETSGSFYGVGIVVAPGEDNLITVISPIKDSPADKAGIKAGDKIITVNGKEFMASDMQDAVETMRGEKDTEVKLQVLTGEEKKTIRDITIIRDEIKVETVISEKIDDLGYIGITQFSEPTATEFKEALDSLNKKKIKGLVLDLRGNPGGIVDGATEIADILLPEGTIVTSKNRDGNIVEEYKSKEDHLEVPMVVLINKGSASASEILAGAIKDFNAGPLIGETSFGKGVIQGVRQFPEGDGIKLTTAEYFTPSGVNIHGIGIDPDIPVKLKDDAKGIGLEYIDEDTQLQRGIKELHDIINKRTSL